jgi:radical SAM protein with 4Fe4S-binding SPASM domain
MLAQLAPTSELDALVRLVTSLVQSGQIKEAAEAFDKALDQALVADPENLQILKLAHSLQLYLDAAEREDIRLPESRFFPLYRDTLRQERQIDSRTAQVRHPFYIHNIELTNRCPLKCIMCPRTEHMTREQGLMSFDLFRDIIDELAAVNPKPSSTEPVWLHHYGESVVHPEFGKFARYAGERGVRAGMSVNPIMMTPKVAEELLDAELDTLYMSLDGHDDASFEKIRGLKNAYEKSKANALRFAALKAARSSRTKLVLSMVNFAANHESIERVKDFWAATPGIDLVLHKGFVTFDGSADEINRMRRTPWNNEQRRERVGFVVCNKPWTVVSITWDGDVVPCCFDYDKKYVLGNAGRQSLGEIWNGEPMQRLRREFMSNRVTNSLCSGCEQLHCPHIPEA